MIGLSYQEVTGTLDGQKFGLRNDALDLCRILVRDDGVASAL